MLSISRILSIAHPLLGLMLIVVSLRLLRRNSDPGIKILLAWGAHWLAVGIWGQFVEFLFIPKLGQHPLPPWVNVVSGLLMIGGQLFVIGTVAYTAWRFWSASAKKQKGE